MTIFVDASAFIAILTGEPEALALAAELEPEPDRLCSAISLWETVAGLCRSHRFSVEASHDRVSAMRGLLGLRLVTIGEAEHDLAREAYGKFGKGRHPAALNMGDCFAYACAKTNRARLLFNGEDFTKTDLGEVR